MREPFADVLVGALVNITSRVLEVAPKLTTFGLLVGCGALGAWALTGLAQAALRAADFDRAAIRWGLWRLLQAGGIQRSPSAVVGGTFGAAFFAGAALLALDGVEVPGAGSVTSMLLGFLPRGLGSILVMVLGVLAGRVGEVGVRLIWARRGWTHGELAARGARWGVRAVAAGIALVAMGVPLVAIFVAASVPLAGVLLGATLGIAQVARSVAHQVAARWVHTLSPTPHVRQRSGPVHATTTGISEESGLRPNLTQSSSLSPQSL